MLRTAVLVVLLVMLSTPGVAVAQSPLDTPIPAAPPLKLDIPSSPQAIVQLIEQLLRRMNVPFALEAIAPPDTPADLAAANAQASTSLNGLTARAALDAIMRQAPQYDWEERNGRVIVRPAAAGADDFLQSTVIFSVTNASARDALDALVKAIPAKGMQWQVGSFAMTASLRLSPESAPVAAPRQPPATLRTISMTGTVREALDAIVTAYGPMSWTVKYRAAPPRAENATIALTAEGASILATRRSPGGGPAPLTVPVLGNIQGPVQMYGQKARVRIDFEQLPDPLPELRSGHAPLDLTGLSVEAALSRIVMLDSRYEWTRSPDGFLVRPRPDLRQTTALDQLVPGFSAGDEPVETTLARVVALLGDPSGSGGGGSANWRKAAAKTHVTLSVPSGTLRALLSALATAAGMSWAATFQPQPNGTMDVQLSLIGEEFSLSRSVRLRSNGK